MPLLLHKVLHLLIGLLKPLHHGSEPLKPLHHLLIDLVIRSRQC